MDVVSVLIDSNPFVESFGDGPALAPEYADLADHWHAVLLAMAARPDNVSCAHCGDLVGYVLYEDDRPVLRWHSTALTRSGVGPVFVMCEGCLP